MVDEIFDFKTQRPLWVESKVAKTSVEKFMGIMFLKAEQFTCPLIFDLGRTARWSHSIHSLFCKVKFDAIFLDEDKRVVDVRVKVGRWNPFVVSKKPFRYLIETPAGESVERNICLGQKLWF